MPKAQKSSQIAPGAKIKQITDFFPRKLSFSQEISLNVPSPTAGEHKDAKQSLVKENTKPHSRQLRSKVHSANEKALDSGATCGALRPHSPLSTKHTHITSPTQPPTKRLRSQSDISNKQTKRAKNILCESKFEEQKMEVEDDSIVYVPPGTVAQNPPLLQVPFLDLKHTETHVVASPSHQLEVNSMVPSSLSEEKELELPQSDKKDIEAVKEAVDRWRYQASSPSSLANGTRPANVGTGPHHAQTALGTDWNTGGGSIKNDMASQPNVQITSSISAPQTDGSDSTHPLSPVKVLDKESNTDQIIKGIRERAYAQSRANQPSSPLSTIASLDSSDDEDELNAFNWSLKDNRKLHSPLKAKIPIKPTRYNLRNPAAKTLSEKPKPTFPDLGRDGSPSPPAKRKPGLNPLDALLKEKQVVNGKNAVRSADREAQIRDLANMNLNDDSDGGDFGLKGSGDSLPLITESEESPFIDDDQKQQVMEILKGDRVIKDEEEHLRQQGKVGVPLWGISEPCCMDSCDGLPRLEYQGSDPILQSFAQIVNHGDCEFVGFAIQSGVLELANYTKESFIVINYLISLALSQRVDGLNVSAAQVLYTLVGNPTIGPIPLLGHILLTLRTLGAQLSLLERLGWTVDDPRNTVSATERPIVVEHIVSCLTDFAKSGCLHQQEVPDIIVVLLLLGIEPSTSHEVRLQVTQAIIEICLSVGEEDVVEIEVETAICNKVLHLIQPYSLPNRLYVLDLLASGGGRIARIARSVAHSLLTGKYTLLPLQYSELPPLSELVNVINVTSRDASRAMGKFEIHETTDYVDMACWTRILAIAITDIPEYVKQEGLGRGMSSPMKSPSKEKDQSLILTLYDNLYKIHGQIQDTRAAHLDRSRTKAVIFQTAFRILYQYQAVTQYQRKNNHDIQSYFRKK